MHKHGDRVRCPVCARCDHSQRTDCPECGTAGLLGEQLARVLRLDPNGPLGKRMLERVLVTRS